MSTYLLLQDHAITGQVLPAGTTQSTADVGGLLPTNWPPTGAVDPLDTPAVTAFYAQGPQFPDPYHIMFSKPATYWTGLGRPWSGEFSDEFGQSSPQAYRLTGLGSALAPIGM